MVMRRIKGTGDVKRNLMACAIDVSDTDTPEYRVVGYRIEDSTLEFNPDVENVTDILGTSHGSVNKMEPTQSFEPHRLTGNEGLGALGEKMLHYFRYNEMDKFSQFKCILIYGFLESDTPGKFVADLYSASTVIPQSIGGSSWADMPFEVTFGGEVKHGSVDAIIGEVTFTEDIEG